MRRTDGVVVVKDDGQTNGINLFPFVCPSRRPIRAERARAHDMVVGIDDGQTNGIYFLPFVCPSQTMSRGTTFYVDVSTWTYHQTMDSTQTV